VTFPDATFGKESRFGVPFTFLLRDILQFDAGLPEIIDHVTDADRTCDLILGFGDGKIDTTTGSVPFNACQYSNSVANFMNDTNMMPQNSTWHAPIS
jgi:exportin-7